MIYPRQLSKECLVFILLNAETVIEGGKKAHLLLQKMRSLAHQKGQEHRYKFLVK